MPGSFFDSNVLVYLASNHTVKEDRAESLVAAGGTISIQVLNEVANVGRRKLDLSWREVQQLLGYCRGLLDVVPLSIEMHEVGLRLAARYVRFDDRRCGPRRRL